MYVAKTKSLKKLNNYVHFWQVNIIDVEEEMPTVLVGTTKTNAKKLHKKTEAFLILERSLNFLSMIAFVIGADMRYDWKVNRRFIITKSLTGFCWFLFIYTQSLYVYQHNSVKTWEVFAIYGIGVSVRVMQFSS